MSLLDLDADVRRIAILNLPPSEIFKCAVDKE
jgi:hypothetical protein